MQVVIHQFDGVSTLRALPLAAGLLSASARRDPRVLREAEIAISTARVDPDEALAAETQPDVLAFSSYVWNERYSLEVARQARCRFPRAFILFGGPSVPRRPERAAAFLRQNTHVDALAFGEGEQAFREILRALLDGRPLDRVAGLALRDGSRPEGALVTAPRERISDFADAGSPYLDGTFDELVAQGFDPGAAILETNRGCPFSCTFCDWGQAVASRVHELPIDRIHAELEWIARRRIAYLYIVDANYGIRRRDVEIVREIGRLKRRYGFPQYVFFHLLKNAAERHLEVVLALREAGIGTHLALSAQDFEPRVLLAVKRDNIRLDRALALRRICHEKGIGTFNELILGLPEQTYDSFADSMVKAVTPWPGDAFHLYLARVLENAEMAAPDYRARYGIESRQVLIASFHRAGDAGPVPEVEEIVVATRALKVADWRRAFRFGFFLAAAHNLRLLDVVLQIAWRAAGIPLRAFLEALLARMDGDGALGEIGRVLDRYADAILAGEAMVLPAEATGDHLWAVEDAVALAALRRADEFHAEVAALCEPRVLHEAVRYQRFLSPAPGAAPREASFAYDFAAWRAQDAPGIARSETRLWWAPSPALAAAPDWTSFLQAYLAAVHARASTGRLAPAPVALSG